MKRRNPKLVSPPPLNTGLIGLLCYYNYGDIVTLSDFIPACQTATQYSNYLDGTVRVWSSTNIGASSAREGDSTEYNVAKGDDYFDVQIRVRADGWILAYLLRTDDHGAIPWFGELPDAGATTNPPEYSTRLSRAIFILLYTAGISEAFDYEDCGYYDYEYTSAAKMYVFGVVWDTGVTMLTEEHSLVYHLAPSSCTVYRAHVAWSAYGLGDTTPTKNLYLYYDANLLDSKSITISAWWRYCRYYDVLAYASVGEQHAVDIKASCSSVSYSHRTNAREAMVVITS